MSRFRPLDDEAGEASDRIDIELLIQRRPQQLDIVCDATGLDAIVSSAPNADAIVLVPRTLQIEGVEGRLSCEIDGRREVACRIGAPRTYEIDRPFAIAIWDHAQRRPIEVGLARAA